MANQKFIKVKWIRMQGLPSRSPSKVGSRYQKLYRVCVWVVGIG